MEEVFFHNTVWPRLDPTEEALVIACQLYEKKACGSQRHIAIVGAFPKHWANSQPRSHTPHC